MAFPTIAAWAKTDGATAADPATVNLPTGIAAGHLLVMIFRVSGVSIISGPSGWTTLVTNADDASDDWTSIYYRWADGSEGATTTIDLGSASKFAAVCVRITEAENPSTQAPQLSAVATGTSATPNPTTCTPTGGAKDYLWLALYGAEGETPSASPPTNYTRDANGQATSGTGGAVATNCYVQLAQRQLNAASEDPGTINITSDDWTAWTMAVHPSGGEPPPADVPAPYIGGGYYPL